MILSIHLLWIYPMNHMNSLNTYVERNKEAKYSMLSDFFFKSFIGLHFFTEKVNFEKNRCFLYDPILSDMTYNLSR